MTMYTDCHPEPLLAKDLRKDFEASHSFSWLLHDILVEKPIERKQAHRRSFANKRLRITDFGIQNSALSMADLDTTTLCQLCVWKRLKQNSFLENHR